MNQARASRYVCHVLSQLTRNSGFLSLLFDHKHHDNFIENWSSKDWDMFCRELLEKSSFQRLIKKQQKQTDTGPLNHLSDIIYQSIHKSLEEDCKLIILGDKNYPKLLSEIPDRPLCLFCKGNPELLSRNLVAIIGSRKASSEALQKSFELSKNLVENDKIVVSGGAYGCDILAHKGALSAKQGEGSTIVVFSGGLETLYPKGNERTFSDILEKNGLLVTERLWHQKSRPYDFPIRNRIISGLCQTTLVMDASVKSGSMLTAYKALDQGRSVFVLKPPIDNLRSLGIKKLIDDGAEVFSSSYELSKLLEGTQKYGYFL